MPASDVLDYSHLSKIKVKEQYRICRQVKGIQTRKEVKYKYEYHCQVKSLLAGNEKRNSVSAC